MITHLLIKNFEAHKKLSVKLDQITTFTGPTDSGKSTIIRAFKWLVTNRPRGIFFLNDQDEPAFFGIKTDKGNVSRKRGKNINNYKLNGQSFEAFGTDVPEEVQQFLNMDELNFQYQFDAPYWFFISPGEVSKQLNRIVDLDIIDSSLSKIIFQIRTQKTAVSLSEERLNELNIQYKNLSFVKPMSKQFNKLDAINTKIEEGSDDLDALNNYISEVKRYMSHTETLSSEKQESERVLKIGNKYKKTAQLSEDLSKIIKSLRNNQTVIESKIPDIKPLISLADEWKQLKSHNKILSEYINDILLEQERICQRKKLLKSEKKELQKMMGTTCPLCGAKVEIK